MLCPSIIITKFPPVLDPSYSASLLEPSDSVTAENGVSVNYIITPYRVGTIFSNTGLKEIKLY